MARYSASGSSETATEPEVGEPEDAAEPAPEDTPEVSAEQRTYALARSIVRSLLPGNGRSNRCDDEDDLRSRLDSDGVIYDPSELPAALSLLENNGDGQYDAGQLPGLPYKVQRPDPPQPTAFDRHPPRPPVLTSLRAY